VVELAAVCAVGLGVAGGTYARYASVWLREPPLVQRCVFTSGLRLGKPVDASGSEPHDTVTGETVYLTPPEDEAVRCAYGLSAELARRLTSAFAEPDADRRAGQLVAMVRDGVPAGAEHDELANAAYRLAYGAMQALPRTDEVIAREHELLELQACRFDGPDRCPARPAMPRVVWLVGVPSALGMLGAVGVAVAAGVRRAVAWWRRRRAGRG
jgi:hypothetical protein